MRCGLIGAGKWGTLLAGEMEHVADVELVAIADTDVQRAKEAAERLGTDAFGSAGEVLADPEVDAVAIAIPNDLHAELALAALDAGKHLLLEKPAALTIADAERIATTAEERGRVLMPDHIQRYYDPLVEVHRLVTEGNLGEVLAVSVSRRDLLIRTTPWLQRREHVGGLLYQSACHEFDFLRWLSGDASEITCIAAPSIIAANTLDYPDLILSQIRLHSGAVAQVWNCMTDPVMGYEGVVTGTEGTAWFDLYGGRVRWRRLDGELHEREWPPGTQWGPWSWVSGGGIADGEAQALRALLADFRDAVVGGSAPRVSGIDGARVVEMAQAGYLSIAERRPVALPLADSERDLRTYLETGRVG
jgi:predicted dehydrogenase